MEKQKFVVQFNNGQERRSTVTEQPDAIFAAMLGQRYAPDVFGQRWNTIADQRNWKIVVASEDGSRYEEPVVIAVGQ
jgi:hypothetical protein